LGFPSKGVKINCLIGFIFAKNIIRIEG
jgi:hypothetical protein